MAAPVVFHARPDENLFRDSAHVPLDERRDVPVTPQVVSFSDPWETESMRDNFAKDIEENLKVLATSISCKKKIDPEFLKILQKDISMLSKAYDKRNVAHDSHVWSEVYRMNIRLQEAAARMHGLASDSLSGASSGTFEGQCPQVSSLKDTDVVVPLVGAIDRPMVLASDTPCVANKGLQALQDRGYNIRKVRGNGHCLFSSMAAHLLTNERLVALKQRLLNMKEQGLLGSVDFEALINTCLQKLSSGSSVEGLLQDEQMYRSWVQLLRTISVNWWRKTIHEEAEDKVLFAHAARESLQELSPQLSDDEVCDMYLQKMELLSEAKYGGAPEMYALEKALGITLHMIDVKGLGRSESPEAIDAQLPKIANLADMWILYNGSHFDPLYLPEQVSAK
jgi:hypothetical protein